MKCASDLKRANLLEIFALEPQTNNWGSGVLASPGRTIESGGGLRGRGDGGESAICEHWGLVDVWLYEGMGDDDGGACQGWAFGGVSHGLL
jgi:hypothetical protein